MGLKFCGIGLRTPEGKAQCTKDGTASSNDIWRAFFFASCCFSRIRNCTRDKGCAPLGLGGGNTYYVDPSGNDANDGSQASPWKTIHHAADVVAAGDTVLINPGTYSVAQQISITTSGTASDPITFKGNGDGVVVDLRPYNGRNGLEIFFADYIVIDNLTVYASTGCLTAAVSV
jgi:hypothetical protein